MTSFAALHRPGDPLLLPNAWDVASAHALAAAGFAAIGTTSLGVASAHGLPDGRGRSREVTLALVRRLTTLPVPFTVDLENGFGGILAEVADLAATVHEAGAAGVNLEDGRPDGTLTPAPEQAAVIAAVKNRVPDLFVNARTDTHWLSAGDLDEALTRADLYRRAGADGIFVPAVTDPAEIRTLASSAGLPLNVLVTPGMTVAGLAALGVARVSTGSLLFRAALAAAVGTARAVASGEPVPAGLPTYAEIDALASAADEVPARD